MEIIAVDDEKNPKLFGVMLTVKELAFIKDLGQLTSTVVDTHYGVDFYNTIHVQVSRLGLDSSAIFESPNTFVNNDTGKPIQPATLGFKE